MIGDILIFENSDKIKALKIKNSLRKNKIVLIGGNSGTKKSEIAHCLQDILYKLNSTSLCISLDDYYLTTPQDRSKTRKELGIEYVGLKEINWDKLTENCKAFMNKKVIHFSRYNKYAHVVEEESIESKQIEFLIVEGLFVNYLSKLGVEGLFVNLEGTLNQTFIFRKTRNKENPEDNFRNKIVTKESYIVAQLKKYSTLLIPYEV